ncbi:unnamed protein product [Arabis nemorensis]|uniref:Uncharacterized protein n=1 Tax=Arabis nemorensis TaxID=586526 RepID=A0A565CF56_9BRAS|nr:unnamed protein product [Arabis nemorensis]
MAGGSSSEFVSVDKMKNKKKLVDGGGSSSDLTNEKLHGKKKLGTIALGRFVASDEEIKENIAVSICHIAEKMKNLKT